MQVKDASLLRFLVDMRDADLEAKQLRDDLMTMLIAGARKHRQQGGRGAGVGWGRGECSTADGR